MKRRKSLQLGKLIVRSHRALAAGLTWLSPVANLAIRLYIAEFFWSSAVTKVANWEQTLFLFTHEYEVPLLSPKLAAMTGTAAELALPVILSIGLMTRLSAIGLFFFNIVAVISYSFLWSEAGAVGLMQHFTYGMLMLVPIFYGSGKLALDTVAKKRFDLMYPPK